MSVCLSVCVCLARGIQGWSESISVCVFGCITVCVWVGVTLAVCGLLFVCVAIVECE